MGRHPVYYGRLLSGSPLNRPIGNIKMLAFILSVILSIEADFTQTKNVSLMSEPQVSTGHMIYRAPDYLQWAYTMPQAVVWEIEGDRTNVNPQIKGLLRMIMASIAGEDIQDPKMQRESKRLFRDIRIEMDDDKGVARQVQLIEKNGDITTIEFTNVITQ